MSIPIRSAQEIERMRAAGRIVFEALNRCRAACKEGATTAQINAAAEALVQETGVFPLFKNYPDYRPGRGFPACTCISVNEEVVHGIPGDRVIQDGDIVSVDFGCKLNGWCADSATTILVGAVPAAVRRMCEATEHILNIAIQNIRPGRRWSQVAALMENYARQHGYGVVREFVGHGIGQKMHEDPKVPNFVSPELLRNDIDLRPGMVLAVEPMCSLGSAQVRTLSDQWTVVTCDRSPAAHYEHTVAVVEGGCEVLTDGK